MYIRKYKSIFITSFNGNQHIMNRFATCFIMIFAIIIIALDTRNAKRITKKKLDRKANATISTFSTTEKSEEKPKLIFNVVNNTNETAQSGSTAILECSFFAENGISANVTWRKGEVELTRNNITFFEDKRFLATNAYRNNTNYWFLRIRYTQESDEGLYECFVECEDELTGSVFVNLTLQRAKAVIKDAETKKNREVKVGAPLRLSCYLNNSIEAPLYIFWYKENRVINYDLTNGSSIREGHQGSELIFPSAQLSDTGNYSCVPSNADQASVYVIVTPP